MYDPRSCGNITSGKFSTAYAKVVKMENADPDYLSALASSHINTVRAAIKRVTKDLK